MVNIPWPVKDEIISFCNFDLDRKQGVNYVTFYENYITHKAVMIATLPEKTMKGKTGKRFCH